jgi:DNA-binding winged helix-turn-helix (wHTH) protein
LGFGDVVIDRGRRVVSRDGTRQSLPETYLNALFLLIDKQPAVVGKAELASVLKVADDSVPKAIELIRKALGEIKGSKDFILTERGVGYRFIGEETVLESTETQRQVKPRASLFERPLNILAAEFEGNAQLPVVEVTPGLAGSKASTGSSGRLQPILWIAIAVAMAHSVLWALAERLFGWNFREGILLPQGFSAVVLSLTMTVPLIFGPPLYEHLFRTRIIFSRHWLGGALIVVFSALGHLILYGSKTIQFVGLRNLISPLGIPGEYRALPMELIYAAVHFSSIVLVYRIMVDSQSRRVTMRSLGPTFIACLIWLSCDSIFIVLKYPASLANGQIILLRGFLNASTLMMTLAGGMLWANSDPFTAEEDGWFGNH